MEVLVDEGVVGVIADAMPGIILWEPSHKLLAPIGVDAR